MCEGDQTAIQTSDHLTWQKSCQSNRFPDLSCLWATWISCFCCYACLRCPGVTRPAALKNTHLEQRALSPPRCAPICHCTPTSEAFCRLWSERWSLSRHQLCLSGVFVRGLTDVILMWKNDERTKRNSADDGTGWALRETSHETMFGQAWLAGEPIKVT